MQFNHDGLFENHLSKIFPQGVPVEITTYISQLKQKNIPDYNVYLKSFLSFKKQIFLGHFTSFTSNQLHLILDKKIKLDLNTSFIPASIFLYLFL